MNQLYVAARRIFIVFLCSVIVASMPLSIIKVNAETPSWTSVKDPGFFIESNNYEPTIREGDFCHFELFTYKVWSSGLFPKLEDYSSSRCVNEAAFGRYGDGIYQPINSNEPLELNLSGVTIGVPYATSLYYATTGGTGKYLHRVKEPLANIEKRKGHNQHLAMYFAKDGTVETLKHPQTAQPITVRTIDASPNGNWLIVEAEGKLVRVNTANFEIDRVFSDKIPRYGIGLDPMLDLTISDDGNYVAVSGSNYPGLTLYNLATCGEVNPDDKFAVLADCGVKELGDFMRAKVSGFSNAFYLQFSGDTSELQLFAADKRIILTQPNMSSTGQLDYLALGDSFSSGEGDLDKHYEANTNGELGISEKCHVSRNSYPYLLAKKLNIGAKFKSIACSGATVRDIEDSSFSYRGQKEVLSEVLNQRNEQKKQALTNFTPGRAAQIQFVEKYKPKVITISIGGNDIGFAEKLKNCIVPQDTNETIGACEYANNPYNEGREMANLYERLKQLYTSIYQASRQSKIYVVGYPQFMGGLPVCEANVGLNSAERTFVRESVKYLNKVIASAAQDAGVKYIDIEDSLHGKNLCSLESSAFNGVMIGDDQFQAPFVDRYVIGNESYHPNAYGHQLIANKISSLIPDLLTYDHCQYNDKTICPASERHWPEPTAYFQPPEGFIEKLQKFTTNFVSFVTGQNSRSAGDRLQVSLNQVSAPGTQVKLEIHSESIELGTYNLDETGSLLTDIQLPDEVKSGYHTIHAYMTTVADEVIDLYQPLLIIRDDADVDGDGVLNEADKCSFVAAANADADKDGIDDACDAVIEKIPLPSAPTIAALQPINIANQHAFRVIGEGEEGTIANVKIDDEDASTALLAKEVSLAGTAYETTFDVTSLRDGTLTISVTLKNEAGIGQTAEAKVIKDTNAPATDILLSSVPNSEGWHKKDVTATFNIKETGSGFKDLTYGASGAHIIPSIARIDSNSVLFSAEGETIITYFASDKAGNAENKKTSSIRIDKTPPAITLNRAYMPSIIGLFGSSFIGSGRDSISGIKTIQATFTNKITKSQRVISADCKLACLSPQGKWKMSLNSLPTGIYKATIFSFDKAGNKSSLTEVPTIVVLGSLPVPW